MSCCNLIALVILLSTIEVKCNEEEEDPCVYTQLYWIRNATVKWPDTLMCGIRWKELMAIDTVKMANPSNMYWVIAFHQYATIQLNIAMIKDHYPDYSIDVNTGNSILFIGDSIERSCDNISHWSSSSSEIDINMIYTMLDRIRHFNHGMNGPRLCPNQFDGSSSSSSSFYFYNTPDMIIIPSNASSADDNNTSKYSLLTVEYHFRQFTLSTSVIACFVLIPIMTLVIGVIYERRRQFNFTKKQQRQKKDDTLDNSSGVKPPSSSSSSDIKHIELVDMSHLGRSKDHFINI